MGLGALHTISLAMAREKALQCRRMLGEGQDPISARDGARTKEALSLARVKTFDQCASAYIKAHRRRLEECQACGAMGNIAGDLCIAGVRGVTGLGRRYRPGRQGPAADLGHQDRDGRQVARQDRKHPRLGHRQQIPSGRESRQVAWASSKPVG
jgi:hypothetical protein